MADFVNPCTKQDQYNLAYWIREGKISQVNVVAIDFPYDTEKFEQHLDYSF